MNNNIPDFVLQIQEVERNIKAEWKVTHEDWQDESGQNFDEGIMQPYFLIFNQYITGDGIKGFGVDDLMKQMDKHLQEMEKLSGVPQDVQFECAAGKQYNGKLINGKLHEIDVQGHDWVRARGGVVHDENRNRDYWDEYNDGAKPGELRNNDIIEIYKEK